MAIDPQRQRQRRLWLAYVIGAFGLASSAQVNFLIPLRARELGAGFDAIGLIAGAGALGTALSSVSTGAAIDRLGPKRSFLLGAGLTLVLSLALIAVQDYWWFLAIKPLHGVARNLAWLSSQTYITAIGPEAERSRLAGRFGFFSNVGQMAGPILVGAGAAAVGLQWAFLVPALYALVFLGIGYFLRETQTAQQLGSRQAQGSGTRSAGRMLRIRGIQVALLLTFVRLWTGHVYITFYSVFLVEGGIDPAVAGVVIGTSGFVAAIMSATSGFWTRFASPQVVTTLGLTCNAMALLVAPFVGSLPYAFLVPVLLGIGTGLSLPLLISIVSTAAPDGQRGIALGLRGFVNQSAATAAPLLVGPLMTVLGLTFGFITGGAVAGGVLVAALTLHRSRRGQTEP